MSLHFAEKLVFLDLALRNLRNAEFDAGLGGECKAFAVEVIAVGYLITQLDVFFIEHARRKAKCLFGLQQVLVRRLHNRRGK